jgi:pyruvate dehydrogenase kinase 2/3/4
LKGALFLLDELPIRLAHRVVELENLPHGLSDMASVIKVKNWYAESFQELIEFPKIELPSAMKLKMKGGSLKR